MGRDRGIKKKEKKNLIIHIAYNDKTIQPETPRNETKRNALHSLKQGNKCGLIAVKFSFADITVTAQGHN